MALFDFSWKAENRCGDWLVVSEDDTYAVAYPERCRGRDRERIARLIAAAPEMLAALLEAEEFLQSRDDTLSGMKPARMVAAAIAKATSGARHTIADDQTHE